MNAPDPEVEPVEAHRGILRRLRPGDRLSSALEFPVSQEIMGQANHEAQIAADEQEEIGQTVAVSAGPPDSGSSPVQLSRSKDEHRFEGRAVIRRKR